MGFDAGNIKITPVLSDLVTHSFCELQTPAAVHHQNWVACEGKQYEALWFE